MVNNLFIEVIKYILRFMVSLLGVFLVMTKITFVPVERDFSVNIDS